MHPSRLPDHLGWHGGPGGARHERGQDRHERMGRLCFTFSGREMPRALGWGRRRPLGRSPAHNGAVTAMWGQNGMAARRDGTVRIRSAQSRLGPPPSTIIPKSWCVSRRILPSGPRGHATIIKNQRSIDRLIDCRLPQSPLCKANCRGTRASFVCPRCPPPPSAGDRDPRIEP